MRPPQTASRTHPAMYFRLRAAETRVIADNTLDAQCVKWLLGIAEDYESLARSADLIDPPMVKPLQ